jgi:hypothetical protein
MPPKSVSTAHPRSSLIKTLLSLSVLDSTLPHSRFVATVGQFIDFSEAFNLADFLGRVPAISANNSGGGIGGADRADTINNAQSRLLNTRGEMMLLIMASFGTSGSASRTATSKTTASKAMPKRSSSMRLPRVGDANFNEGDQGLSAYLRFYALQQSEMESRIVQLHTRIRRELTAQSSPLAQLAALDGKLNEVLASYSRKALGVIPSLLRKRFHYLFNESLFNESLFNESEAEKEALAAFLREMQTVLLAELEIRLQPTLGLIEALATEEEEETR